MVDQDGATHGEVGDHAVRVEEFLTGLPPAGRSRVRAAISAALGSAPVDSAAAANGDLVAFAEGELTVEQYIARASDRAPAPSVQDTAALPGGQDED